MDNGRPEFPSNYEQVQLNSRAWRVLQLLVEIKNAFTVNEIFEIANIAEAILEKRKEIET